jgi:aminoglycoside 6'-N-acetyltransferase
MSHSTTAEAGREAFTFRPLTRDDFPLLREWLTAPHVRDFWPREPLAPAALEEKYGPRIDGTSATRVYVIEVDGHPVGIIQCFRFADRPERRTVIDLPSAGLDCFIGDPDRCGRGLGTAVCVAFTRLIFSLYPDISVIVAYPSKHNHASCRALDKAGFVRLAEHKLDSDDPAYADISAVYVLPRR